MGSLASHVAVTLEIALTRERAERYQQELAKEHDRLRVLLEVNNHVVTKLDILDLFRAASASIRSYVGNDFTGFWLIGKDSNHLELTIPDFPASRGFLTDAAVHELSSSSHEKLRARKPELLSLTEIANLPSDISEKLKAESIAAVAITPLTTAAGFERDRNGRPLGEPPRPEGLGSSIANQHSNCSGGRECGG